jgi:hypothetical protein
MRNGITRGNGPAGSCFARKESVASGGMERSHACGEPARRVPAAGYREGKSFVGNDAAGPAIAKPDKSPPREFRLPLAPRILSLVGAVFIGAVGLGMAVVAIGALASKQWNLGIIVALCAAVVIELTRYVARDLTGKWGLRIVFDPDSLGLFLPANRSLIHKAPRQKLSISYSAIAAIETRLEAYASLGMANMQRAYVLRLANGDRIYLFEERALGTGMQSSYFGGVVDEIARRSGAPIEDLGMAKGDNGVLGVWGTQAADWASPALPAGEQQRMWGKAVGTGRWAFTLILLGLAARGLFALLG